jgi:hypothetical protein
MANITIRNIPEEIFEQIKKLSLVEKRSINNQLLVIIEKGTQTEINQFNQLKHHIPKSVQMNLWENLSGSWEDNRTADEIISEIYNSRTQGREINL